MSAIDHLKAVLGRANDEVLSGFTVEQPAAMDAETRELQAWLGGTGSGAMPPREWMHEAIRRFWETRRFAHLKDARLVCFGCGEPVGKYKLIEDKERFGVLLSCVDEYRPQPRVFRRCYRGLLTGYFSYDPDGDAALPVGKQNWGTLRSYLGDRIKYIHTPSMNPDWALAINDHKNLLTEDPCGRYGLEGLRGEDTVLQMLRSRLEIADTSWVIRRLILARIDAAASRPDAVFAKLITEIFRLLEQHPLYRDEGLARVLTRYSRNTHVEVHPELRDTAVSLWGNPWLTRNEPRWGRVAEPVRKMVGHWLKLDFIRQFFGLLAEDGSTDTRRLDFWESYVEDIGLTYFALGSHASTTNSPDFKALRKKMEGLRLHLHRAGPGQNNAFIMLMGDYVVVEFGLSGNACFIFRRDGLPFSLEGYVAGDSSGLKHPSYVRRLTHVDTSYGRWEKHFAAVLSKILPSRTERLPEAHRTIAASTRYVPLTVNGVRIEPKFSAAALQAFVRTYGLQILDHRSAGGALWVDTDSSNRVVSEQLKAWGFRYSENKGRWWKGER